jgi:hypothetical protein
MRALIEAVVVLAPLVAAYAAGARGMAGTAGSAALLMAATAVSLGLATRALRSGGRTWGGLGLSRPPRPGMFVLWCMATVVVVGLVAGILRNVFLFIRLNQPGPGAGQPEAVSGGPAPLAVGLAAVWIVSAFGEELLFRGYLMDRILRALPAGKKGSPLAVLLCAVLYGLAHLPQGGRVVVLTGAAGIAYGAMYFGSGRSLWVTVFAHGILDTLFLLAGPSDAAAGAG